MPRMPTRFWEFCWGCTPLRHFCPLARPGADDRTRSSSTEASHVGTKQEERGRQLRRPLLVYLAELLF